MDKASPMNQPLPTLRVPRIRKEQLDNGLEVYLLPDHRAPIFTFQVWFRVGSSNEREGQGDQPGITGMSHFFEHLMFRGTRRHPDPFDAVYTRGGHLNAWTWYDATCYWEKMPAGNLPFVVSLEADRLKKLGFDLPALEREREVVRNERLLRSVNDPSGAIDELLHARAFTQSPYRWPIIGWPLDLIALKPQQARHYFESNYVPTRIFIVLAGDFDSEEALELIEQEYSSLPRVEIGPLLPCPEPAQRGEHRGFVEKDTSNGLLQMAFHSPSASDPDYLSLQVLDVLLARGKSSRLHRRLVSGDDPVASSISSSLYPMVEPYLYRLEINVAPGRSNMEVEQRIELGIEELRKSPPSDAELRKAVNMLRAELVRSCLDTRGKADMIGFSVLCTGAAETFLERITELGSLCPEDIRRVAGRYLRAESLTVVSSVNPDRLANLTRRWLEAAQDPARALLTESTELAARRHVLGLEEKRLSEESRAISLLEERIAQERSRIEARDGKAGEDLLALEQFEDDAEKGTKRRSAELSEAVKKLEARIEELEAPTRALLSRVDARSSNPSDPWEGALLDLARAALDGGSLPKLSGLDEWPSTADLAMALLHRARLSQRSSSPQEACSALEEVLALARLSTAADSDPMAAVLEQANDLAWECRVY